MANLTGIQLKIDFWAMTKNQKNPFTIFLLITFFLSLVAQPSYAIFGLSKCEKVKKQIQVELQIGDSLFKEYRNSVNLITPKKPNETFGNQNQKYMDALSGLKLVLDSDVKAWGYAEEVTQCFSTEQNSTIRVGLSRLKDLNSKISTYLSKPNLYGNIDLRKVYTGRIPVSDIFFTKKK